MPETSLVVKPLLERADDPVGFALPENCVAEHVALLLVDYLSPGLVAPPASHALLLAGICPVASAPEDVSVHVHHREIYEQLNRSLLTGLFEDAPLKWTP